MRRSFRIIAEIMLQVVGEEKQLQNSEDDKEFYQDNCPQRPAETHATKPADIKRDYPCRRLFHFSMPVIEMKIYQTARSLCSLRTRSTFFSSSMRHSA